MQNHIRAMCKVTCKMPVNSGSHHYYEQLNFWDACWHIGLSLGLHGTSVLENHNLAKKAGFCGNDTHRGIHNSVQFAPPLAYSLYNSECNVHRHSFCEISTIMLKFCGLRKAYYPDCSCYLVHSCFFGPGYCFSTVFWGRNWNRGR